MVGANYGTIKVIFNDHAQKLERARAVRKAGLSDIPLPALLEFVATIKQKQIPQAEWAQILEQLVTRYRGLKEEMDSKQVSSEGKIQNLDRRAKAALDKGELAAAEDLLQQASDLDDVQQRTSSLQYARRLAHRGSIALLALKHDQGAKLLEKAFSTVEDDPTLEAVSWLLNAGLAWDADGNHDAQLRVERKALDLAASRAGPDPSKEEWLEWKIRQRVALSGVAIALFQQGHPEAALESDQAALTVAKEMTKQYPSNLQCRLALAVSEGAVGRVLWSLGRSGQAQEHDESALFEWKRLRDTTPSNPVWQAGVVHAQRDLAALLANTKGQFAAALTQYKELLATVQSLAAADTSSTQSKLDLADCQENIGSILALQGREIEADDSFQQALKTYDDDLLKHDPNNREWRMNRAMLRMQRGSSLSNQGRSREAIESFTAAQDELRSLSTTGGPDIFVKEDLAFVSHSLGSELLSAGDLEGALASYQTSLDTWSTLDQSVQVVQQNLAGDHTMIGLVKGLQGHFQQSLVDYKAALVFWEKLADGSASEFVLGNLVSARADVASVQAQLGNLDEALKEDQAELATAQSLLAKDASHLGWRQDAADAQSSIGDVLTKQGHLEDALKSLREALAIREEILVTSKTSAGPYQIALIGAQLSVYDVLFSQGHLNEALSSCRQVLDSAQKLASDMPSDVNAQRVLVVVESRIGIMQFAQGHLDEAAASLQKALKLLANLGAADSSNIILRGRLSRDEIVMGDILLAQGHPDGALASYQAALSVNQRTADLDPTEITLQDGVATANLKMGETLLEQGGLDTALPKFQSALAIRQKLVASGSSRTDWQSDLARAEQGMADILAARGSLRQAFESLDAAIGIQKRLAGADASNAQWQSALARSHHHIGLIQTALGRSKDALKSYQAALIIRQKLSADEPFSADAQNDLVESYMAIGAVEGRGNSKAERARVLSAALQVMEKLQQDGRLEPRFQARMELIRQSLQKLGIRQADSKVTTAAD